MAPLIKKNVRGFWLLLEFYNAAPITDVAIVYDERMELHSTPTDQHIYENAERIARSLSILNQLDILPRMRLREVCITY